MSNNNNNDSTMKTALVLGATGAVGKQLLKDLLKNGPYAKVVTVGRRNVELDNTVPQDKLVQNTVNFDNLEASRQVFRDVDDVYCCLGTTRKDAGSAEQFRKIDQDYVVNSAKMIVEENPTKTTTTFKSPVHFLYCSSMGANKDSYLLYPQSKGQTEDRISRAGFEKVSIFRPGALETVEPRPQYRPAEAFIGSFFFKVNSMLNLHMGISVLDVGRSMRLAATSPSSVPANVKSTTKIIDGTNVNIFTNKDMDNMKV
ncbi:uncharacterized protein BX664DRAFT_336518 [Halteromyces radiatus]|uniref:uncharacterized protein n=1 Tax=Halteromyces radiatus TaxID=101107 RepID=UPI00222104F8|nr:uncharacterized protein BX664DRAFT_336518 [Halteromyces radiatus]KAI8086688.1 hypothetical protein BX664DRAFT_336518 [Halteromyces radiatus]